MTPGDLCMYSINQNGGINVMSHSLCSDSENFFLLKHGPKSSRFKFTKVQNVITVGICYAKFIFILRLHGIVNATVVRS